MKKQVTYCDYLDSSEKEEVLSLIEMLELFDKMNWKDGREFASFPIDDTYIFQMMGNKNGSFIAEFTDTVNVTSYQKLVDKAECRQMIKAFFEKQQLEPNMLKGFEVEQPKTLYNSIKGSPWKKILFWVIFIGFFVALLLLSTYFIYK